MVHKPTACTFVLVEGVSDVAFISAYLNQVYGFRFQRGTHRSDGIYSIDFYERERKQEPSTSLLDKQEPERLAIVSCDGHTSFDKAFKTFVKPHFDDAPKGARIRLLVIEDADEGGRNLDSRYPDLVYSDEDTFIDDERGWNEAKSSFGTIFYYKATKCLIPYDGAGCLETVIMDSIHLSEPQLVDESIAFVDHLSPEASSHIKKRRKRTKAKVGIVFTLLHPDGTYKELTEKFEEIDCTCETIAKQFSFFRFLEIGQKD